MASSDLKRKVVSRSYDAVVDNKSQEKAPLGDASIYTIDYGKLMNPKTRSQELPKLRHTLMKSGFCMVTNHNVPRDVQEGILGAMDKFFESDRRNKEAVYTRDDYPYGFDDKENLAAGQKEASAKAGVREMKEDGKGTEKTRSAKEMFGIRIGAPKHPYKMEWPKEPANFEEVATPYWRAMEAMSLNLLDAMFYCLSDGRVESFPRNLGDDHSSCLRLNYYPHQDKPPQKGVIRCAQHTDYGPITILRTDGIGGLEAFLQEKWIPIMPKSPYDYVINFGDTMMRWSNKQVKATLHRVVNPDMAEFAGVRGAGGRNTRRSLAWFYNLNWDAVLKTLDFCVDGVDHYKNKEMTQGELIMMKHGGSHVV